MSIIDLREKAGFDMRHSRNFGNDVQEFFRIYEGEEAADAVQKFVT